MNSLPIILADTEIMVAFQTIVKPIFAHILEVEQQSTTLITLRDALLPKLINGEIEV